MKYPGKTAVVTGAGSGIGRALAIELAARGAKVALSDINDDTLAETVERCRKCGVEARGYHLDVADRAAVLAHADDVVRDFGTVNIVVNNAGVGLMATVEEMSWEDLDWLMGINFWGVIHGTKAFLPALISSGEGHMVNVSSVFGFIGVPSQSAYNAAKFGVRGFTEALRQEMLMAGHPVAVSCVHPGGVKTNIAATARSNIDDVVDREEQARRFERSALTTPERAARIILRGMARRKARILVGPDAYLIDAIPRLSGSGYQRLGAALGKRVTSRLGLDV
jgi:NAD(P)-dependent dehydrogenase (short-subunit alcohol dehydrogenase family)